MLIALPIWEKRVSPVFDVAEQLLLVEVQASRILRRRVRSLTATDPAQRAETLHAWGVELLICGAISHALEQLLLARCVKVVSRIRGEVEEVLAGYLAERLDAPGLHMPGCSGPLLSAESQRGCAEQAHSGEQLAIGVQDVADTDAGVQAPDGMTRGRRWVASDGQKVIGLLELHVHEHVGQITRLDFDPSYQQYAVSCRLLHEALSYSRRLGLLKVTLNTSNQSRRALRLIGCFGFQPSERLGQHHVLEFYLNLYRDIDEQRCGEEVRRFGSDGTEA